MHRRLKGLKEASPIDWVSINGEDAWELMQGELRRICHVHRHVFYSCQKKQVCEKCFEALQGVSS